MIPKTSPISITTDKSHWHQAVIWLIAGLFAAPISIILHELGHFLMAHLFGVKEISFHWAYIDYDKLSATPIKQALISFAGPMTSYTLALLCWQICQKRLSAFVVALGFFAPFRGLVGLGYIIQTLRGTAANVPFEFDEFNTATTLGISPLIPIILSLFIFVMAVFYFGRTVWQKKGSIFVMAMILGVFSGLILWNNIGPLIFPGGKGFE